MDRLPSVEEVAIAWITYQAIVAAGYVDGLREEIVDRLSEDKDATKQFCEGLDATVKHLNWALSVEDDWGPLPEGRAMKLFEEMSN